MKTGPDTHRRKRILIFYSLAMLLPGLVLGYLAYRGILNDQALREKEARQKMESVSRDFFTNLDSLLNVQMEKGLLADTSVIDPNILISFSYTADRNKEIRRHQLLYLPSDQWAQPAVVEPDPDRWIQGWELEYTNSDLDAAFEYYRGIEDSDTHQESKLKALVAMARIRNKQDNPGEALDIYREISQSYAHTKLNGQIPARALALSEMAALYQRQPDPDSLASAVKQLIDCLIHPKMEYAKAQFLFFKEIAGQSIGHPDTDSLWTLLNHKQFQSDQLLRIFTESDMLINHFTYGPSQRKYIFQDGFAAAYIMTSQPSGEKNGLVLDLIPWMNQNHAAIFSTLNREPDLSWKLTGEEAMARFSSEDSRQSDWLTFSFTENLPPWKLLLAPKNIGWAATIFQPGNGVFVLIFGFIILIMIGGLAFTIHILNQELRLNKLKTDFISNVSHELKSPLTSIRQMTEMLHHQRIDTEEQRNDYYSFMLDQSEHLSHLIDNILDFSRMEEHRKLYHFKPIDLAPVIEKMTENFRRQFSESGFEFDLISEEGRVIVQADKEAIRQVFYNLMDNALKYSGKSRKIRIQLKAQEEVCVSVRDWGIGIEKKDQEKIFERFFRSGAIQKMGIKGSGIGLTLVKGIVEAHQGRLEVESQPGEGTTFYVYIPVYKGDIHEEDLTD